MIEKPVWPEPDMSLFETTNPSDWRANARMDHRLDWGLYILGYQEATNLLLEKTASGRDQDTLIYPILFNARQAIELGLKEVIRLADRLLNLDDPSYNGSLPWGHPLRPLWDEAKERIAQVETSFDPGALDDHYHRSSAGFERLVRQLDSADPGSFNFRYPVDKKDQPSFLVDDGKTQGGNAKLPRLINTRDLKRTLNAMFTFLTGLSEWLTGVYDVMEAAYDSVM